MASIGEELRADLGSWLRRRQKKGVEGQGKQAQKILDECGVPLIALREQWKLQQAAQLSIRAREYLRLVLKHYLTLFRCTSSLEEGARHGFEPSR